MTYEIVREPYLEGLLQWESAENTNAELDN